MISLNNFYLFHKRFLSIAKCFILKIKFKQVISKIITVKFASLFLSSLKILLQFLEEFYFFDIKVQCNFLLYFKDFY